MGKGIPRVHPIGTARRIQAANARGWSCRDLGWLLGVSRDHVIELRACSHDTLTVETADQVRRVVEYLHTRPAPQDGARIREHATRNGYARLDAWLPDEIDDPDALSDLAYQRTGRVDTGAEAAEKLELGYTVEQIAAQRGVKVDSVRDALRRHARRTSAA